MGIEQTNHSIEILNNEQHSIQMELILLQERQTQKLSSQFEYVLCVYVASPSEIVAQLVGYEFNWEFLRVWSADYIYF